MNDAALGGFGDSRRAAIGTALLKAVQSKRTFCIHLLAGSRNQALRFNNFLSNPGRQHRGHAGSRRADHQPAHDRVLAIMDTTDVVFP